MTPQDDKRTRPSPRKSRRDEGWHWSAVVRRQMRGRAIDIAAIIAVFILGCVTTYVILKEQDRSLPEWVPVLGQQSFEFEAEFATGHAIMPGQGQAVVMSGVQVGKVADVQLEDGKAVIGMELEPEYGEIVREDAQLLLRPKTGLNDMVIELEPGTAADHLEEGERVPLAATQPNIQPDEFFAMLDADTRSYIKLLVQAGAEGLEGNGRELSAALRRFEPFARFIARFNGALAERRRALADVVHDFQRLTTELSRADAEIERFVGSSAEALEGFANREADLRESLRELPSSLSRTRSALEVSNRLSNSLRPTLTELIPQASALQPGLESLQSFFAETTAPIRDQIRPFARDVQPVLRKAVQGSDPLKRTVGNFGGALDALNYGFNELAFNPGSAAPGYLFYLPWLNHNMNLTYSLQDAEGPFRRSLVLLSCNTAYLADGATGSDPLLKTIRQGLNIPSGDQVCPS